jgi:hypothetical protein
VRGFDLVVDELGTDDRFQDDGDGLWNHGGHLLVGQRGAVGNGFVLARGVEATSLGRQATVGSIQLAWCYNSGMVCPDVSTFSALAENVLKRCIEPTGGSPVRVSAGAPGSRVQRGEEILSAERIVESLTKEGAKVRAVTIKSEACSLDRLSAERRKGGPSPSCQGEGERQRGKTGGRAGTPRGIGHGTERRLDAEQERPSSAARRQGRAGTYKAMPKWSWCREGVRGARSTGEGVQQNAPEGRSPALVERAMEVSARA